MDGNPVAGDTDHGDLTGGRQQGGVDRAQGRVGDRRALERQVGGGNQGVRLAAPEGTLHALDRRIGRVFPAEPSEAVAQNLTHALRRVGPLAEESQRVRVDVLHHIGIAPVVVDDLHQVGSEDFRVEGSGE